MFVFSRVKYNVLIVRHMIYGHHCLCLCLPELHSVSLLLDISSMTFLSYVCVFQSLIVCPYLFDKSFISSLILFVSCRDKYNLLNVRHIIYDHCYSCLCIPKINTTSLKNPCRIVTYVMWVCFAAAPLIFINTHEMI